MHRGGREAGMRAKVMNARFEILQVRRAANKK